MCVYVRVAVYICVSGGVCLCASCLHVSVCFCVPLHVTLLLSLCEFDYVLLRLCVCVCLCVNVCLFVYLCVYVCFMCVCVCLCIFVCV